MAYLEIKRGDAVSRAELDDFAATIGRLPDNSVIISDQDMSRHHCAIEKGVDGFRVHDLKSRNGTRVNGQLVQVQALNHGDVIRVGTTEIRFVDEQPAPEAAEALEAATESSGPTDHRRRNRTLVWGGVSLAIAVGVLITAMASGWLGDFSKSGDLGSNTALGSGINQKTQKASPAADDDWTSAYELITAESLAAMNGDNEDRPVRARFFGTPTLDKDGSLHWELPPGGDLIAIIDQQTEAHTVLAHETALVEAELCGMLRHCAGQSVLCLRVGELRIIRAADGRDDALQPATRQALGKRLTASRQFIANAAGE